MSETPSAPQKNPSTSMGFLTLVLLSAGILLLGWGLMALLNMVTR